MRWWQRNWNRRFMLTFHFYNQWARGKDFKGPGFRVIDPANGNVHICTKRSEIWAIGWNAYGQQGV